MTKEFHGYRFVRQLIMDNIRNGMWLPEERVPSEARLVAALGVSKGSVERAVRELAREGVVTRIRGIGTFVATANVRRVRFVVRSLYRATRSCADVSVVFARESDACPAIASTLEIESGSRFFHSLLLHSTAGAPITLEEHFIDAAAAPNYLDQDFRTVRPGEFICSVSKVETFETTLRAVAAEEWEASLLEIARGGACLEIRRRTRSTSNHIWVERLLFPSDACTLEGRESN